ncbi:MAG: CHAT domain-containing protein [Rubrivivax sp.]|nr:CHAT domain-containing protein [Pyrinomonadaceae bacterium]
MDDSYNSGGTDKSKMSLFPQHLVTRGSRFLCCLLLAHLLSTVPRPVAASVHASPGQSAEPLTPGQTIQKEIGGREIHTYVLTLTAKQYARVLVKQQGIDVVVTILDLDGTRARVDRPNGSRGREAVSFIAKQDGSYRLEVRTLERTAPRERYEISVDELREATPRDESRIAAEQAVTEGEILRARKTAVSLPQAREKFDQSASLWRALDEPYEVAVALYGRCLTHRLLGNNEQAITDCTESLNAMRALGDSYGEAAARTGRAWSYIYLGETGEALTDFTASIAARRRIGDRQGETLDLLGTGWVYSLRGDYEKAIDYFQQSIKTLDELGDPRGKPIRLAALGEVHRRMNRPAQAAEYLTQSLQLSRAAGNDRGGEAETLTNLGWCRYALGQLTEAQDYFVEALPMRREIGDRTGQAITLLGLAHVERAQGNLHNAQTHVEAALTIIEHLRAQVASQPLRLSFFALAQDYYEFYVDLLMHMRRLDPARGGAAAALEVSERARARSLLDLLQESDVDVRQGVPAELLERERALRSKLNAAANYQRQLLGEPYSAAQAAAAAKDVDDLTIALGETEAQIRQSSPRYAALTQPQTLSARSIQRELADDDTLLLEYALGKERSYVWAVSPTAITAYELPARREVETAAVRVRELLTARDLTVLGETPAQKRARIAQADTQYHEAASGLSRVLLAPVAAQLGTKRIVIVAPGALQLIPFGALPLENGAPLIVNHEVAVLPSASTLAMLRRDPTRRTSQTLLVTIIADPVFSRDDERFDEISVKSAQVTKTSLRAGGTAVLPEGGSRYDQASAVSADDQRYRALPRLFRTRWEAEQIAALAPPGTALQALDFTANRETVTGTAVGNSGIIHFATHAIINDAHPELSGIALSMFDRNGRPQDGFLRAHDIFNLNLSADLIVLSACRTGLGKDFKGEGLVGLVRGFMYAGAPRVVGSLWSTDDKATAELMVRFYRKMLKERLRPAAALRAAQVEMWREKRWHSPYFWAGFTLQGDWR